MRKSLQMRQKHWDIPIFILLFWILHKILAGGRVVESYGEDPYLAGELGKQMILGLQSEGIVATPKHFAVYSIPVGGRDGGTRTDPHVAPREMKTLYLEPFRKGIQEAGALGVMSSYNDYDGEPVSGSYHSSRRF